MKFKRCQAAAALILAVPLVWHSETARSEFFLRTQGNGEQSAPQGNDPPGPDQPGSAEPAPGTKDGGVIIPPPTGDEEMNTTVPNPNAGHDKEVLPPPGTPENSPDIDPRVSLGTAAIPLLA